MQSKQEQRESARLVVTFFADSVERSITEMVTGEGPQAGAPLPRVDVIEARFWHDLLDRFGDSDADIVLQCCRLYAFLRMSGADDAGAVKRAGAAGGKGARVRGKALKAQVKGIDFAKKGSGPEGMRTKSHDSPAEQKGDAAAGKRGGEKGKKGRGGPPGEKRRKREDEGEQTPSSDHSEGERFGRRNRYLVDVLSRNVESKKKMDEEGRMLLALKNKIDKWDRVHRNYEAALRAAKEAERRKRNMRKEVGEHMQDALLAESREKAREEDADMARMLERKAEEEDEWTEEDQIEVDVVEGGEDLDFGDHVDAAAGAEDSGPRPAAFSDFSDLHDFEAEDEEKRVSFSTSVEAEPEAPRVPQRLVIRRLGAYVPTYPGARPPRRTQLIYYPEEGSSSASGEEDHAHRRRDELGVYDERAGAVRRADDDGLSPPASSARRTGLGPHDRSTTPSRASRGFFSSRSRSPTVVPPSLNVSSQFFFTSSSSSSSGSGEGGADDGAFPTTPKQASGRTKPKLRGGVRSPPVDHSDFELGKDFFLAKTPRPKQPPELRFTNPAAYQFEHAGFAAGFRGKKGTTLNPDIDGTMVDGNKHRAPAVLGRYVGSSTDEEQHREYFHGFFRQTGHRRDRGAEKDGGSPAFRDAPRQGYDSSDESDLEFGMAMDGWQRTAGVDRTGWRMATPYVVVANLLLWRSICYAAAAEMGPMGRGKGGKEKGGRGPPSAKGGGGAAGGTVAKKGKGKNKGATGALFEKPPNPKIVDADFVLQMERYRRGHYLLALRSEWVRQQEEKARQRELDKRKPTVPPKPAMGSLRPVQEGAPGAAPGMALGPAAEVTKKSEESVAPGFGADGADRPVLRAEAAVPKRSAETEPSEQESWKASFANQAGVVDGGAGAEREVDVGQDTTSEFGQIEAEAKAEVELGRQKKAIDAAVMERRYKLKFESLEGDKGKKKGKGGGKKDGTKGKGTSKGKTTQKVDKKGKKSTTKDRSKKEGSKSDEHDPEIKYDRKFFFKLRERRAQVREVQLISVDVDRYVKVAAGGRFIDPNGLKWHFRHVERRQLLEAFHLVDEGRVMRRRQERVSHWSGDDGARMALETLARDVVGQNLQTADWRFQEAEEVRTVVVWGTNVSVLGVVAISSARTVMFLFRGGHQCLHRPIHSPCHSVSSSSHAQSMPAHVRFAESHVGFAEKCGVGSAESHFGSAAS